VVAAASPQFLSVANLQNVTRLVGIRAAAARAGAWKAAPDRD
jgi:hypothetical protein